MKIKLSDYDIAWCVENFKIDTKVLKKYIDMVNKTVGWGVYTNVAGQLEFLRDEHGTAEAGCLAEIKAWELSQEVKP